MLSQKADRALAGPVAFGLLVTPVCLGIYAAAKANHLWGTKRGAQERSLVSMRFLLRALIRSCFWLKVEEPAAEDWKELDLPRDKGCILMFNHTSLFDGFLMAAIMPSSLTAQLSDMLSQVTSLDISLARIDTACWLSPQSASSSFAILVGRMASHSSSNTHGEDVSISARPGRIGSHLSPLSVATWIHSEI